MIAKESYDESQMASKLRVNINLLLIKMNEMNKKGGFSLGFLMCREGIFKKETNNLFDKIRYIRYNLTNAIPVHCYEVHYLINKNISVYGHSRMDRICDS